LGELLREARKRRGLTLEQISQDTKIPLHHLEALEHDKPGVASDRFYRRAEIRSFARIVHLDEDLALARLERGLQAPIVPVTTPAVSKTRIRPSASPLLLGLGVAIAAAILWSAVSFLRPVTSAADRTAIDAVVARQSDRSSPSSAPQPPASGPSTPGSRATTGSNAGQPGATDGANVPARSGDGIIGQPAPAENEFSKLVVTTEPAGARVTVNGIGWGTAPVAIDNIPAGVKRVRVTKEGFATKEQVVRLQPGGQHRLAIRLLAAVEQ